MTARKSDDPLVRAKAYPYSTPPHSYLFVNGAAYELVESGTDPTRDGLLRDGGRAKPAACVLHDLGIRGAPPLDARVPVLAHGSNAAPATLARKYARIDEDVVIPVIKARLAHFDVVYATHFSGYGSIPSTLAASQATVAEIAVTFLTPHQLALMHECELSALNYVYGRLGGLGLDLDGLGALDAAHVYVTRHGHLGLTGAPLALAAIAARDRRFTALTKVEVLGLARDHLAPGHDLDAFIFENLRDAGLRRARSAALRRHAQPLALPGFVVLEPA
ncbi:MAG: hypothetical protein ACE5LF_10250 [Alphaproteobacteria bacterium]